MYKSVIIADDLTGANATGALLAKSGLKVETLMAATEQLPKNNFDVLALTTDSRGIAKQDAYKRVSKVAQLFSNEQVAFFNKRIDSTLRGNIGSEIDALLDTLADDTLAIVVASFPNSGRISLGGYLLVDGVPLEKTSVANDPTCPVTTSKIESVLLKQTHHEIGFVPIEKVLQGCAEIQANVLSIKEQGKRIVIIDACTNEDIQTIAEAITNLSIDFIAVDPGPFTEQLVKVKMVRAEEKTRQKLLFAIGSVSELTRLQIAELKNQFQPYLLKVDSNALLQKTQRKNEINRAIDEVVIHLDKNDIFVVTTTVDKSDVIDLQACAAAAGITVNDASELITSGLAEIAQQIIRFSGEQIGGVYTSGGDVTVAFCHEMQATGIEVKDEIIPLAVYGRIIDGKYHNKPIITKGGLIGDKNTLVLCANYMLTKVSTAFFDQQEAEISKKLVEVN